MALNARARDLWNRVTLPPGVLLAQLGLTANAVTTAGLALSGLAAWLLVTGRFGLAGWVLVAAGLADGLDGAVARARNEVGPAGSFYDSVVDRLADGAVLAAVAWVMRDRPVLFALAATALVAAQATSYVRAKAESLGVECALGLIERSERAIVLMVGLVFHRWLLDTAVVVLAVGGSLTVAQRVVHVLRVLRRERREADGGGAGPPEVVGGQRGGSTR